MKNEPDIQLMHTMRQENQDLIMHLAHNQFIQLKIGTKADFEKLWREAFFIDGTLSIARKNQTPSSLVHQHFTSHG